MDNRSPEQIDFLKQEYQIAINSYLTQISLMIKLISGFVLVNATLIGLGIRSHSSWLFLLGAVISFGILVVAAFGEMLTRPFLLRAVELEKLFAYDANPLVSFWCYFVYGRRGYGKMMDIIQEQEMSVRAVRLRKELQSRTNAMLTLIVPVAAILAQIVLSFYLATLENWKFW